MEILDEHMKLARIEARRISHLHRCDFDEALSDALLSTIIAHRTYDPTKGAKLSTWTIKQIRFRSSHHQRRRLQVINGCASDRSKWFIPRFAVIEGLSFSFYDGTFEKVAIKEAAAQTYSELLKENRLARRDRTRAVVLREYMRGKNMEEIAAELGVTRQRINQIMKEFPDWRVRMLQKLGYAAWETAEAA